MAKAFSVASWNVEHFKGKPNRVAKVTAYLKDLKPDIFAIYEVKGGAAFTALTESFPNYSFHITEALSPKRY